MTAGIRRRRTRRVRVGSVVIGGGAPISIQSMTKTKTADTVRTLEQIQSLERSGCDIVRVSVKDRADAEAIREIKKKSAIPIVGDIHFDYRLAIEAINAGVDKIRVNPGNIRDAREIGLVARSAKSRKIPIRIGINSGSLDAGSKKDLRASMVRAALRYIRVLEKKDFCDIIVSLKSTSVIDTIAAYKDLGSRCDYPFHLGVTAAGLPYDGTIKSSIGIGALLLGGIGDTIRVSLTGSPEEEVRVAKSILSALQLRSFEPAIISCPTCGRCQVNLAHIARKVKKEVSKLAHIRKKNCLPQHIAIMGCEVNGPGEAKAADIGIAAGKGQGVLFRKGRIIRKIKERDFIRELLKEIQHYKK